MHVEKPLGLPKMNFGHKVGDGPTLNPGDDEEPDDTPTDDNDNDEGDEQDHSAGRFLHNVLGDLDENGKQIPKQKPLGCAVMNFDDRRSKSTPAAKPGEAGPLGLPKLDFSDRRSPPTPPANG
jgi:hypothetical protein